MPIHEMVKRQGLFEPEQVAMLGAVFDDVLQTLSLVDRQDSMTEMVAKKLIEIATAGVRECGSAGVRECGSAGVRDPDRLKHLILQTFESSTQPRSANAT
jgi:hypothetical protein